MIPAVQDFTQRLAQRQQQEQQNLQAVSSQGDGDGELLEVELLGKALISPEQLRTQLLEVRDKKAVVVMLVDLLDASGSLMTKVRETYGINPYFDPLLDWAWIQESCPDTPPPPRLSLRFPFPAP
jgi:hypothetical protein